MESLGGGQKKKNRIMSKKTPVTLDGVTYDSLSAAARALGVSVQAVWNRAHPESIRRAQKKHRRITRRPRTTRGGQYVRISKAGADALSALQARYPGIPDSEIIAAALIAALDGKPIII